MLFFYFLHLVSVRTPLIWPNDADTFVSNNLLCVYVYILYIYIGKIKIENDLIFINKLKFESDLILSKGGSVCIHCIYGKYNTTHLPLTNSLIPDFNQI